MKKFLATLRSVSSFIAGILVGLSLWIMVFAIIDAFPDEWQTLPVFGASIILVLGITLQIVATSTKQNTVPPNEGPGASYPACRTHGVAPNTMS